MQEIVYHNLTQAIGDRLVYFRSTDIEQGNYRRLLWCIPDEWFYLLYKGNSILVVDKSSNGIGKIEKIFIPVLNDVLNWLYYREKPRYKKFAAHFMWALNEVQNDRMLHTRMMFWADKIKRVRIKGKTIRVKKESNIIQSKQRG